MREFFAGMCESAAAGLGSGLAAVLVPAWILGRRLTRLALFAPRVALGLARRLSAFRLPAHLAPAMLRSRAWNQFRLLFAGLGQRHPGLRRRALLGLCLAGAFALELSVLLTFTPPDAPEAWVCVASPETPLNPDYLDQEQCQLAAAGAFPSQAPGLWPLAPSLGAVLDQDAPPCAGLVLDGRARPLMCFLDLPGAAEWSGFRPRPELPSMRLAVRRYEVRMPVDPHAFHPLDKEALLAAAGEYLGSVFRMVDTVEPAAHDTALAAAPKPRAPRLAALPPRLGQRPTGRLSALFESGEGGIYAIGWDARGGTSYGKYQMASRQGTVEKFLAFLDERAPDWAHRLRAAGRPDSGGPWGGMAREWRAVASDDPARFERLQDSFILSEFYSPSVLAINAETGLDVNAHPSAVREVLWSVAVQHGPGGGADIFIAAARRVQQSAPMAYNQALLEEIFRERERRLTRAHRSDDEALRRRLELEKSLALALLGA
jgi:hypothetical protein